MRKKTVNHLADTIFWYVLYFFPVICYLVFLFVHPGSISTVSPINFIQYLEDIGLTLATDNIIVTTLSGFFGVNGTLPFFSTDALFIILAWFVGSYLAHLAIDFVLLLPRLCHKWFNSFTKE